MIYLPPTSPNSIVEMIHLKVMPKQFLFSMNFLEKQPRKCWVGIYRAFISLEPEQHFVFLWLVFLQRFRWFFCLLSSPKIKHSSAPFLLPVGPQFIPCPPKLVPILLVTRSILLSCTPDWAERAWKMVFFFFL